MGRSITILMADDDADDREMAKEAVKESRLHNELRFVQDGEELLVGGEIAVSSSVGKGTTFEVSLPIGAPAVSGPSSVSEEPRPRRRARVLVVDDEIALVKSTVRLLAAHHDIYGTSDPHEVLARIHAGESFDAIICDLMMPQMTGSDLYREMTRIAPSIAQRVVFATGGAFTPETEAFLDEVKNPVLEKPFQRAVLLDTIRQIVEKTA